MIRKLLVFAGALALPALLAAQTPEIPNDHASPTGKAMVLQHSQGLQHRATHRRGEPVGLDHRPTWIAQPPAQRAQPGVSPAVPPTAHPPQPATPAQPPAKPLSPGQSGNHRP